MKRRKRPDPVELTTPVMLGWKLASARKSRKLSIEDAAHETHISAERLRWIEAGNLAAFGNMTYARSFVRAYSLFLGVDESALLARLPARGLLGGRCDYRYLTNSYGAWLREREPGDAAGHGASSDGLRDRREPSILPAAMAVFLMMLAGAGIWGMQLMESSTGASRRAEREVLAEDVPMPLLREPVAQVSPTLSYANPVAVPGSKAN